MSLSRVITIIAVVPAIVFWLMVDDYVRGGDSSDQMIKAGIATTANVAIIVSLLIFLM